MNPTNSVARILDELRSKLNQSFPVDLTDPESRLLVGFQQFEVYASVPVAAWNEGVFSEEEFAELVGTDMVDNLLECAEYIDTVVWVGTRGDNTLADAWRATTALLRSWRTMSRRGHEFAKMAIALFYTSIGLRTYLECSLLGKRCDGLRITADGKRIAVKFLEGIAAHAELLDLPMSLDDELVHTLNNTRHTFRQAGWI